MSSIISIDDLNSYMNKSLTPAVAQQVVDAVNAYVQSKTNRSWGETTQATERYDWKRVLYLRHQDVLSIDAVTVGYPGQSQQTIDSGGYYVNSVGRLTFFAASFGLGTMHGGNTVYNDWLSVTYSYGVIDVPEDLKLATLGLGAGFYNWAINGNRDIVATSVGTYHVQFSGAVRGTPIPNPAMSTADTNWQIIASYATKRF